jgi:hypothetical protein
MTWLLAAGIPVTWLAGARVTYALFQRFEVIRVTETYNRRTVTDYGKQHFYRVLWAALWLFPAVLWSVTGLMFAVHFAVTWHVRKTPGERAEELRRAERDLERATRAMEAANCHVAERGSENA